MKELMYAMLMVATFPLLAGCGSDDTEEEAEAESVGVDVSSTDTVEATSTAAGLPTADEADNSTLEVTIQQMCELAVEPSYLPWLDQGEMVLESGPITIDGQSSLQWYEGPEPLSGAAVTLLVDVEPVSPGSEQVDLFLEGLPTTFGTSAPDGGFLLWEINQPGCGGVGVSLENVPDLGEAEVREELTRIARGLQPR